MHLSDRHKKLMFHYIVDHLPDSTTTAIIRDQKLSDRFQTEAALSLKLASDLVVSLPSLTSAVRAALTGGVEATLRRNDGSDVHARLEAQDVGTVVLHIGDRAFRYEHARLFSNDAAERRSALEAMFATAPLSADEETMWLSRADGAAFTDDDVAKVLSAHDATPENFARDLSQIRGLDASVLTPDEPGYYHRLVAGPAVSISFRDYLAGPLAAERRAQYARHPEQGLRRIAFAALTPALVPHELLGAVSADDICALLDAQDPFSLLCGFELASRRAGEPSMVAAGEAFLERLFVDREAAEARRHVFSGCAAVALCRATRAARARQAPVYWTRMVALAHAGVLTEALAATGEWASFHQWAHENFGAELHWSVSLERREAPRWSADLISPDQVEAELIGRALGALHLIPESERPQAWTSILEAEAARIDAGGRIGRQFFPGPLDDFASTPRENNIEDLEETPGDARSLSQLPRLPFFASVGRASPASVDRLIKIVVADEDLAAEEPVDQLIQLQAVADIAAAERSVVLSDAVIERCIARLKSWPAGPHTAELLSVGITACAAVEDRNEHRRRIGDLFYRFAWANNNAEAAHQILRASLFLKLADPGLSLFLAPAHSLLSFRLRRR